MAGRHACLLGSSRARMRVIPDVRTNDRRSFQVADTEKMTLLQRITVDPDVLAGRPSIRGLRIRVSDILSMLAGGAERAEILSDFPYLESQDIEAALEYAARSVDHRVIDAA